MILFPSLSLIFNSSIVNILLLVDYAFVQTLLSTASRLTPYCVWAARSAVSQRNFRQSGPQIQ